MSPGRNQPCICGSGKKFKRCCGSNPRAAAPALRQEAEVLARPRHDDSDALAHCTLGNNLTSLERFGDAVESYRHAVRIKPDYVAAHFNMGNAQQALGQLGDAAISFRQALRHKPDFADAHLNLGNALKALGRADEAVGCYRNALALKPDFAMAWSNLGATLNDLGKAGDAMACCLQALELDPNYAEAYFNLANAQRDLGRPDDAAKSYRLAIGIRPQFPDAWMNLGNALAALGQLGEAVDCLRRALQFDPGYARAHMNLGNALKDMGCLDEALASYRRALDIDPDYAEAYSNLLFCRSHIEVPDPSELFLEHREFGQRYEEASSLLRSTHVNLRDPERRLRVGFVSADLRNHAVASFFEPVLELLCHSPQLSLHAYSNHPVEDDVTLRMKGHFAHWTSVARWSDEALAQKIRDDGIDILVDLSGHTGKNRLRVFARKPAPIQASWLGYPGTTGLKAVDYYLADHFLLPDESFQVLFTERIVYLPATAPFLPSSAAPDVGDLPALRNGFITFGSFNRMSKLSPSVVALWSELLRELPQSRMILVGIPSDAVERVAGWFADNRVARQRLELHPRCEMSQYLLAHQAVDLCLDTFPYHGATTTSHALWMGVPTLTLTGRTVQSRVGSAILTALGLEPFVSSSHQDFVSKGVRIASDVPSLARLRSGLRARFKACPVTQPALISSALERALRLMWRRWCADLPPTCLDVSR